MLPLFPTIRPSGSEILGGWKKDNIFFIFVCLFVSVRSEVISEARSEVISEVISEVKFSF